MNVKGIQRTFTGRQIHNLANAVRHLVQFYFFLKSTYIWIYMVMCVCMCVTHILLLLTAVFSGMVTRNKRLFFVVQLLNLLPSLSTAVMKSIKRKSSTLSPTCVKRFAEVEQLWVPENPPVGACECACARVGARDSVNPRVTLKSVKWTMFAFYFQGVLWQNT